jgi:hypothetical protein
MASTLLTCTSGARPALPSLGDTLFETDTNRIILWDDTDPADEVWRVYNSDGIAYNTVGTDELQYPTGLWSSAAATYYISTSPAMHFDARILDGANAANNPSDGAAISAWGDRSGNATDYDATQASAGSQPTFADATSGPGSQPAVVWDVDVLDLATTWSKTGSCTAIFVSQSLSATETNVLGYTNYLTQFWMIYGTTDYLFGASSGSVSDVDVFNMYTLHRDGTSAEVFKSGGTSIYGPATRTAEMFVSKLGDTHLGGSQTGTISEILVFDDALSTADLNVIRLYIANKYSLTTAAFT